jgi:hypothetical protein
VPRAIEEVLRWETPVPHSTFRYTTQDVALGGTVIPGFAQVIISLAAANRDPDRYANPETLDITRADTSHLAFGRGIHHCLGARLARLEAVIAFTALHRRFPTLRLAVPPSALRWDHGDGLVLRGLSDCRSSSAGKGKRHDTKKRPRLKIDRPWTALSLYVTSTNLCAQESGRSTHADTQKFPSFCSLLRRRVRSSRRHVGDLPATLGGAPVKALSGAVSESCRQGRWVCVPIYGWIQGFRSAQRS